MSTNLRYKKDPENEYGYLSEPLTSEELAAARESAQKYASDFAMRSCWKCNSAHANFLDDTTTDFLFTCFDCGAWYFNGMDITDREDSPNE